MSDQSHSRFIAATINRLPPAHTNSSPGAAVEPKPHALPAQVSEAQLLEEFCDIYAQERLYPVYQPIVDITRKCIYGYEALIRGPADSALHTPLNLFRMADQLQLATEFEILCRKVAIQKFAELALSEQLFLNISPSILMSPGFEKGKTMRYLQEFGVDPGQVVIEVTEHQKTSQYELLNKALKHYRSMGFKVALDDLGAGYSGLRLWTEVLPDFIKIDKHFIRDIQLNPIKQSVIRGLVEISTGSNCRIIAEGVEKQEEYEYLSNCGFRYLQGYYFALPTPTPPVQLDQQTFRLIGNAGRDPSPQSETLASITHTSTPINASTRVKDVLELLQKKPELDLIPIICNQQPTGLVERYVFLNQLMQTLYGVELYGKQPIGSFLQTDPVLVDLNANLEKASEQVTSMGKSVQAFIVTRNNEYFGVATVLDLLQQITRQQIHSAKHANPLTLLPGMVPTNQAINSMLSMNTAFAIVYFDLDHFKPYNDQYGYEAGDQIICKVAELLVTVYPKGRSMIGHIGGDDFIVIDKSEQVLENCQRVLEEFAREAPAFYREEHRKAGGLNATDRQGKTCFFPMLSLSAGIVPAQCTTLCKTHIEISDLASEAKKKAKLEEGNSWFINHRNKA